MRNIMDYADGKEINNSKVNAEETINKASDNGTKGFYLPKGEYLVSRKFFDEFFKNSSITLEFEAGAKLIGGDV